MKVSIPYLYIFVNFNCQILNIIYCLLKPLLLPRKVVVNLVNLVTIVIFVDVETQVGQVPSLASQSEIILYRLFGLSRAVPKPIVI